MNKEIDVIEFEDGKELPVIDAIKYNERIFLLASEFEKDSVNTLTDNVAIYEKIGNQIVSIEDEKLYESLAKIFEKRLNNNE